VTLIGGSVALRRLKKKTVHEAGAGSIA